MTYSISTQTQTLCRYGNKATDLEIAISVFEYLMTGEDSFTLVDDRNGKVLAKSINGTIIFMDPIAKEIHNGT